MRVASSSIRLRALRRPASSENPPRPSSSAYPRMDVSGVRNSCDASATNWRRRSSEADFSENASSIWVNISFRATPRRPTSVSGLPSGTRRARSPDAMASAVPAIWRSGRRPRRTTTKASTPMENNTARLASNSTLRSELSVSLVGLSESAVTSVPWGTVTATARYCPSGSPWLRRFTASGSGRKVPL